MKNRNYWLKIDNAGKIFPAVSNSNNSSTFRLSFYLNEEVDKLLLEEAVNNVLPRFDSFNVKIKNGLFWNYLVANNRHFVVEEENSIIGEYKLKSKTGYCFRVLYYQKRITLETFHSISDGTGALEFLKSIVYQYLKLKNIEFSSEDKIYSEKVVRPIEKMDAFTYSYDKKNKLPLKEEKAFFLTGETYPNNFNLFVKATMDTTRFKELCRSKNATATEYVAALFVYSIYKNKPESFNSKKPIKIFIPVNLRKYFKLETLRNFSLYIKVTVHTYHKHLTFDDILEITKNDFKEQLNKETLERRINANVFFEKNLAIRLLPLFLKNIAFKIAYKVVNSNVSTVGISNLGVVDLPSGMYEHVTNADFSNTSDSIAITMITVKDKLNLMFTTRLRDKSVIYSMINSLKKEGIDLLLQMNSED